MNVSGNTVYNSSSYGITLGQYTESCKVAGNRVYGSGTGIYDYNYNSGGATLTTVSGNFVFDNSTGIYADGGLLVTQNTIYGQSSYGIEVDGSVYEILANSVYGNATGIYCFANGSDPHSEQHRLRQQRRWSGDRRRCDRHGQHVLRQRRGRRGGL